MTTCDFLRNLEFISIGLYSIISLSSSVESNGSNINPLTSEPIYNKF